MAKQRPNQRLTRADWAEAALAVISEGGLTAVAVEPLAARLGKTKGSFYWHFRDRDELIAAALERWEVVHTTAVQAEVEVLPGGPVAQLRLLFTLVTRMAERDRIGLTLLASADHPAVGPALERVTRARIAFTAKLFGRLGFAPAEARRRALLAYSVYLGHVQLTHSTPVVLPRGHPARNAYLDHVLDVLTATAPATGPAARRRRD